jgi:hypothetical protein
MIKPGIFSRSSANKYGNIFALQIYDEIPTISGSSSATRLAISQHD